ncbi:MAG: hypothetical protein DMG35_20635 [Acidobacteria bacterium]|nr:MAG: hypothetical protein DMG35_20635 [Acidobacteriota bacterium]
MKNLVLALALLGVTTAAAPPVRAQAGARPQQPPTVASVLNTLYGIVEQQVVSAAEAMPEDKYSFAPTSGEFKGVRTFAEEVKHIGFANHLFFGPLMGETIDVKSLEQNTNGPAELKTKAEIVQYLKDFRNLSITAQSWRVPGLQRGTGRVPTGLRGSRCPRSQWRVASP